MNEIMGIGSIEIKWLCMDCDWAVQWRHIPRMQNQVADALAKEGLTSSCLFYSCPSFLRSLVLQDCMGIIPPFFDFR